MKNVRGTSLFIPLFSVDLERMQVSVSDELHSSDASWAQVLISVARHS